MTRDNNYKYLEATSCNDVSYHFYRGITIKMQLFAILRRSNLEI